MWPIVTGKVTSAEQIAARDKCSMTISLVFLTSDLVRAAVEGRLPRGIGIARLRHAPAEWSSQYRDARSDLLSFGRIIARHRAAMLSAASSANRRSSRATYPAVCSGPHYLAMRMGQQHAREPNETMECWVASYSGLGATTTPEYWIDGRRIRAAGKAPARKRPCHSRAPSVDPSFFVRGNPQRFQGAQNEHRSRQLGSRLCARSAGRSASMRD